MEHILIIFLGCLAVNFITWAIIHCNGRIIISTIDLVLSILPNQKTDKNFSTNKWLSVATERETIILGIVPLAVASLVSTAGGNCRGSLPTLIITEAIALGLFVINYLVDRQQNILLKSNFFRDNRKVFGLGIIWCLVFSVWSFSTLDAAANFDADRLMVNGNADMWLYARRFAAYTSNNLSFDNNVACDYLQVSPKKLSSFIGSILVYFTPSATLAISLFQGLFSCSLFLSLFGTWYDFSYNGKSLSRSGTILALLWGLTSPTIFWLVISSYTSNILFITIFVLGITALRNISLYRNKYPPLIEFIFLFSLIVCIFSFYLVLLPIALLFFIATIIIYRSEKYIQTKNSIKKIALLMLSTGIIVLICFIIFPHQISLGEVTSNLNLARGHGKNFVPLNPWSLLQERLNPMPVVRDFGVWFNIIIGTIFSGFLLRSIISQLSLLNKENKYQTLYYKDLIAASLVILAYIAYLLAYIPLEYTYRLGKFAVSIIYPLAILGFLPAILWYRDRYYKFKSRTFKIVCLILIVVHIILHISKMDLSAKPMGKYQIISTENVDRVDSLSIIKCQESDLSQKYQKIVGLDLAKKYPHLKINVLSDDGAITNAPQTDLTIRGQNLVGEDDNVCSFEIDLRSP